MTSNYSTINVEKENNRVKKISTFYSELILQYITLTGYYIAKEKSNEGNYRKMDMKKETIELTKCKHHK